MGTLAVRGRQRRERRNGQWEGGKPAISFSCKSDTFFCFSGRGGALAFAGWGGREGFDRCNADREKTSAERRVAKVP